MRKGEQPKRVVLRDQGEHSAQRYVTHVELLYLDGGAFKHQEYLWGHYESDLHKAMRDYDKRVAEM